MIDLYCKRTLPFFVGFKTGSSPVRFMRILNLVLHKKMLHVFPFGRFAAYTASSMGFYDCSIEFLEIARLALIGEG